MPENGVTSRWSVRGWRYWLVLALILAGDVLGNWLLTRSIADGLEMAGLLLVLTFVLGSMPGGAPNPTWSPRRWPFWVLCVVCWLMIVATEWVVRHAAVVAIGRATLMILSAIGLGLLVSRGRRRPGTPA